jgi:AcrR family transcriptional regulator
MTKHHPDGSTDGTSDRLLLAAGEEFARVGFASASVRTICEAAGANVSAVKYHYGSKEALYLAVWEAAAEQMVRGEPMPTVDEFDDPRDALRAFIGWFMRLVLIESDTHPWAGRLLAHETVSPTAGALDVFVKHCAKPVTTEISRIIKTIVGHRLTPETHDNLVFGVVALCVNPKHSSEILTTLGHPPPRDRASINRMAKVMAEFAISGLSGFAYEGGDS